MKFYVFCCLLFDVNSFSFTEIPLDYQENDYVKLSFKNNAMTTMKWFFFFVGRRCRCLPIAFLCYEVRRESMYGTVYDDDQLMYDAAAR